MNKTLLVVALVSALFASVLPAQTVSPVAPTKPATASRSDYGYEQTFRDIDENLKEFERLEREQAQLEARSKMATAELRSAMVAEHKEQIRQLAVLAPDPRFGYEHARAKLEGLVQEDQDTLKGLHEEESREIVLMPKAELARLDAMHEIAERRYIKLLAGKALPTERTALVAALKREFPNVQLDEKGWQQWAVDILTPPDPKMVEEGRRELDRLMREGKIR